MGITGVYYYDLDSAWLGWFGVLPEYRNKGIGCRLLNKTIKLVSSMGFKYLRLYMILLIIIMQ